MNATGQAEALIEVAKAEVGYREEFKNGRYNNNQKYSDQVPGFAWSDYQAWCDTFVAWCFWKAGMRNLLPGGGSASCLVSVAGWKKAKRWSEYPALGAQVMFGRGNGGAHTGIVYNYDDTYIYTVEGNTNTSGSAEGNGVYLKKRLRRDPYVYGYGYPAFKEGIKSADPAWAKSAPKANSVPDKVTAPDLPDVDLKTPTWEQVFAVDAALTAKGFVKGSLQQRYADLQKSMEYTGADADGYPGVESLKKLGFEGE